MIHAKELRFGNKVQTQKGKVITVQQILANTLIYDTRIRVSREVAGSNGSYRQAYNSPFIEEVQEADFQDIDPIVLTPRILGKCGFRNFVRDEWIYTIGNSHLDFEFTGDGLRLRNPTPSQAPIRTLHQLQNFLLAIAEHELEVEL
jgi:hypothetical protein